MSHFIPELINTKPRQLLNKGGAGVGVSIKQYEITLNAKIVDEWSPMNGR